MSFTNSSLSSTCFGKMGFNFQLFPICSFWFFVLSDLISTIKKKKRRRRRGEIFELDEVGSKWDFSKLLILNLASSTKIWGLKLWMEYSTNFIIKMVELDKSFFFSKSLVYLTAAS